MDSQNNQHHTFIKPDRRTFLKGMGVTIALPFLPSNPLLAATNADRSLPPKRMVMIASGLGMYPGNFFPKNYGNDFTPSPTLAPLAPLRNDLTVFSHMDHPGLFNKHGGMRTLLTGRGDSASIDQVAANHVGYKTRFPSLHISIGGSQGSSRTKTGITKREFTDPRTLFDALFVKDNKKANAALKKEIEHQGSVLDLIRVQAKSLAKSVNQADKDKLDEYLTAIRESETQLQGMKYWSDKPKPTPKYEIERPHSSVDYPVLAPMMFDLIYLAIQSDSSRVITAGFGMHNKVIEIEGVKTGYHSLSHHGRNPEKLAQLLLIERFYMEQYGKFIQKLKDTKVANHNLLEDTMVFFGSGLSDAARHSNRDLPIILAGGGLQHKGHVNAKRHNGLQTPLNNLYTTMLQNFGVELEQFNDATGTVTL